MNIHQHHRFQEDHRIADARALPPEREPGASLVAIWHAGWAVMVSLAALIAQTLPGAILAPTTQTALLLTSLPGVLGVRVRIVKLEIFEDCEVAIRVETGLW